MFSIPLQNSPQLVQSGFATHGRPDKVIIQHYRLPALWCIHHYRYKAVMEIDGERWEVKPGSISLVPPNRSLTYHYNGLSQHQYAHFLLEAAPEGTNLASFQRAKYWYEPAEIPQEFDRQMQTLIDAHARGDNSEQWHKRAEVALWELLWQLTELSPQNTPDAALHPCLQKSFSLIESRLSETIHIAALSHEVGLSHNQLTRLFVAQTGQTVVAYIRARRASRALHLLQNSTLSIKAIAAQVGTPQLGQFNHLMRRECGQSPRALRFKTEK